MIELKTPDEVDAIRAAGIVVADALSAVKAEARAGVSLAALDQVARDVLADAGASSPFLGYRPGFAPAPFPAVICTSVNDAVLHGIPDGYRLRDGDLLSIDFGAVLDGGTGLGYAGRAIVATRRPRAASHRPRREVSGDPLTRGPGTSSRAVNVPPASMTISASSKPSQSWASGNHAL